MLDPSLPNKAKNLLDGEDVLDHVQRAMRSSGYGGSLKVPLLIYLAATTRLLSIHRGGMPSHIALLGTTSSGKNYALDTALALLPKRAYCVIAAGSPRALIYDEEAEELSHRALIFHEVDSLPTGEDNTAASAIRNLLQDHALHYAVVEKEDGRQRTRHIRKDGPTILITTTTRRLPPQMSSRLFYVEMSETRQQIQKALAVQGEMYSGAMRVSSPPKELRQYQKILQKAAPWKVRIPYAPLLAREIGSSQAAPRATRDFAKLMALIQAVAVLNFWRREVDGEGNIVADLTDYAVVWRLTRDAFAVSLNGGGKHAREVVDTVRLLRKHHKPVTVAAVARHLSINKVAALRRVQESLESGWVVNRANGGRGHAYDLDLGDPLPPGELPSPIALGQMIRASP
jgi:hypothetical protein